MSRLKETRPAWAIETRYYDRNGKKPYNGYVGVYRMDHTAKLTPWQDGVRHALFRTRKEAREHLKLVKGPADRGLYPRATVVRVQVTVATVPS